MGSARTEDGGRPGRFGLETARRLVTFGFLVPADEGGRGGGAMQSTNELESRRRTLLRRAAWAAGGLVGARRRPPSVGAR